MLLLPCSVKKIITFTYSYIYIVCFHSQNCAYYWGFSAWLAYYINHPLYTPPCKSIHVHTHSFFSIFFLTVASLCLHSIWRTTSKLCISHICGMYSMLEFTQYQQKFTVHEHVTLRCEFLISPPDVWTRQLLHTSDS